MSEKRYAPSPKRLKKAQKDGNTRKSQLCSTVISSAAALLVLWITLSNAWVGNRILLEWLWTEGSRDLTSAIGIVGQMILSSVFPSLVVAGAVNVAAQVIQGGWVCDFAVIALRPERLSIAKGIQRITRQARQLPWIVIRAGCVVAAGWWMLAGMLPENIALLNSSGLEMAPFLVSQIRWYLAVLLTVAVSLGCFDMLLSRRRYREQVFMTFEEMKREHREDEGDPFFKAHRKAVAQAAARQDLVERVRRATMIVIERKESSGQ